MPGSVSFMRNADPSLIQSFLPALPEQLLTLFCPGLFIFMSTLYTGRPMCEELLLHSLVQSTAHTYGSGWTCLLNAMRTSNNTQETTCHMIIIVTQGTLETSIWDRVSLCSAGWPGIHYVEQTGLNFMTTLLSKILLSAENTGLSHYVYPSWDVLDVVWQHTRCVCCGGGYWRFWRLICMLIPVTIDQVT